MPFKKKPKLIICLHTVKWFQELLFDISNSIYQIFLSNLILIIYFHTDEFKYGKWLNISIWPLDRILTGSTTLGQSRPGSNGNEGVLYIPQSSSISWSSPSDAI